MMRQNDERNRTHENSVVDQMIVANVLPAVRKQSVCYQKQLAHCTHAHEPPHAQQTQKRQ